MEQNTGEDYGIIDLYTPHQGRKIRTADVTKYASMTEELNDRYNTNVQQIIEDIAAFDELFTPTKNREEESLY